MSEESEQEPNPQIALSAAPHRWLEESIAKLRSIAFELSTADSPDEVMRLAIIAGRAKLGFNRIGAWFFDKGRRSLTGTYGVNAEGELVDERHCRIFDRGSIGPQAEAWSRYPYYFLKTDDVLRDSEGGAIGRGVHFTLPLVHQGEQVGMLTVDNLLESPSINDRTGELLGLFADLVSAHYFLKVAESEAMTAEAASERADALKHEFLGVLSHEVRTPLNAILGFAQLLCLESDSPNQIQLAKTIEQSGDHLLNLLNSMMDYAHLADEDLRRRFSPCDPVSIARDTVESFSEIAVKKGLEIAFRHEGSFDGFALADPLGLRQILGNLVQNAIKFTSKGSLGVLAQTQVKPGNAVAFSLSVSDTGRGIPPERLTSIFKPFEQVDSSLTRDHGGIGMGLAIVERLVWSMGGRIRCASEIGRGSVFTIDFIFDCVGESSPVARENPEGMRVPALGSRSDLKLLVAEDDENNRNLLLSVLGHIGYRDPDQAINGEEAAELISQKPYDLVILDLQMPKRDGLQLTRMVREGQCGPINADVPIIGLTAHYDKYDRDRCSAAGMNRYLVKPFKAASLEESIVDLLNN